MSDGNAAEMMPLDGPWVPSFTVAVKFDGYARMWCEDLQLGATNGIADLVPLFGHIYQKADELIKAVQAIEDEAHEANRVAGRERIAASLERVKQRR